MKFLNNVTLDQWNITGLLGKKAKWFFGFSRVVDMNTCPECIPDVPTSMEIVEHIPETGESLVLRATDDGSGSLWYRMNGSDPYQKMFFGNLELLKTAVKKVQNNND